MTPEEIIKIASQKIEFLLSELGVDLDRCSFFNGEIRTKCPVHDGDNETAFCYYVDQGKWTCYTQNCQEENWGTIGLVRALLKKNGVKKDAYEWIKEKLNITAETSRPIDNEVSRMLKDNYSKARFDNKKANTGNLEIRSISSRIQDSEYFIKRGIKKETLKKFYVGYCSDPKKPMYLRSYVPVLDESGQKIIGMSGRIVYDECHLCGEFHNPKLSCPVDSPKTYRYPKWYHLDLNTNDLLYNDWNASKYVQETGTCIVVESPKDVWKLYEAGFNNVIAIFGIRLLKGQADKLLKMGATSLVLALDNDEAGTTGNEYIMEKYPQYFTIYSIDHKQLGTKKNISDLDVEKIKEVLSKPLKLN